MASKGFQKGLSKQVYQGDEPPTPQDMELSNKHLRQRIKFNKKHENDHKKMRLEAEEKLRERGELT
jgi:hypothetical protein